MTWFGYDGFKIAYEVHGAPETSARPLVLIHGLLFPRKHHRSLALTLADRGNRVILIDLLGHGTSDCPKHSRHYTMEIFGRQVIGLLDHLDIPQAVLGGTSLGANAALEATNHAPERVKAMILEMPVLERAVPVAALFFVPLTMAYAQLSTPINWMAQLVRRAPTFGTLYGEVFRDLLSRDPVGSAAVLHGLLTGRVAPHPSDREKMEQPALIMGHYRDLLHPFSDAEALHRELHNSELVQSSSFFELRFPPNRLSDRVADFLDEAWSV